jgi:hypothetical protein
MSEQATIIVKGTVGKLRQSVKVMVPLGISVLIVLGYTSVLGVAKATKNKTMQKFFANPIIESLLAASVAGVMAAAVETYALDSRFRDVGGLMPAESAGRRLAVRALVLSVSFAAVMSLTTYLSGRMGGSLMCGSQSSLQKKICTQVAAQANIEAIKEMENAGEPVSDDTEEVVAVVSGSS